jgi:Mg2+ and Co2+ transporter CorA
VRSTQRGRLSSSPESDTSDVAWIDVLTVDRRTLEEVGRRAELPLELVTYCLLSQRRPKVVPCAAWLYCAWQVPVCSPAMGQRRAEISLRMVEVKVCLGPRVIVTAHESGRLSRALLSTLLSDGAKLVREGPSRLLVTLAERVSDMYVSALELLAIDDEDVSSHGGDRGGRARAQAGLRLLRRDVRAHREAIEKLRSRGRRWLDSKQIDRLSALATRLDGVARDRPPAPGDPWHA